MNIMKRRKHLPSGNSVTDNLFMQPFQSYLRNGCVKTPEGVVGQKQEVFEMSST